MLGGAQEASVSRMGKAESTYNPLASLPPTSRLLLTSQEGTLCRGHKTGIHLMKTKKKKSGDSKITPQISEMCCQEGEWLGNGPN